ncbi:hypothetical protein [Chiayiivirga flava]|uniref:Phytase-like domain-containing protein n=1 Tax=Chiayiivirga flava TaxID=659595 RepID=A0A7W8G0L6_9GAMM|nr:hypothetical protein [Chiayiivirga flava]MBB5208464.1 hypothetical protein [Chiayiivirga flava]
MKASCTFAALLLPLCIAAASPAQDLTAAQMPSGTELRALVTDARVDEISGIAASRRHPGLFWVLNDSDRPAEIYALDDSGAVRATLALEGVRNVDWEDISSFEVDGTSWLMIADTGDNGGLRRELAMHFVEEPAAVADATVPVARSVRFVWPDGPRDCEGSAVDVQRGEIYLVSKKRIPPELFRLPLAPRGDATLTAERVGTLAGIEQPTPDDLRRNPVYGRYRAQITGLDIASDGSWLAALNYRRVYLWQRVPEGWAAAVTRPARAIEFPWIPQAEAIGFDVDNHAVWISSERLPAPLMRLELP